MPVSKVLTTRNHLGESPPNLCFCWRDFPSYVTPCTPIVEDRQRRTVPPPSTPSEFPGTWVFGLRVQNPFPPSSVGERLHPHLSSLSWCPSRRLHLMHGLASSDVLGTTSFSGLAGRDSVLFFPSVLGRTFSFWVLLELPG